ncbi:hypothetical protein ACJIZ3_008086 [Penstemon smallii]|uniref:Uncharacterized protein n=1 Tax=Penstemon smallii TaxID=265156 RepID=A0ABD3T9X8_9LAMI
MERCMRKCKGLGEVAVMEKTAETVAAAERKRKISFGESELSTFSVQLKTRRLDDVVTPENSGNSTTESVCSDHVLAYCSSSTGFKESLKSVDLEEENEVSAEFFATSVGDSVDFTTYR